MFTWATKSSNGYEVSTHGDKRFSAFNAIMPDGRSIEQIYQCETKSYDPGGTQWWKGKGRKARDPSVVLWDEYLKLWTVWAHNNMPLMRELYILAKQHNSVLTDCFAKTPVNQARALAEILNELVKRGK